MPGREWLHKTLATSKGWAAHRPVDRLRVVLAGTSLLALIDDIASLLDDVSILSKVAAKKTAGVLGDDLALNAEQVTGVRAERELPVVWAVARGSALNKLILVPTALGLSYALPMLITPLLMLGGAYLSYEGFEKVLSALRSRTKTGSSRRSPTAQQEHLDILSNPKVDVVALEKKKIRGAIRTDFILSAEIVVITLGTVQDAPFLTRAAVVTFVATILTIGVYALVAAIVKMDDVGQLLLERGSPEEPNFSFRLGGAILYVAPRFLRVLSVLGTIAMFLVGGGILTHGVPPLARWIHGAEHVLAELPHVGTIFASVIPTLVNGLIGVVAGGLLVGIHHLVAHNRQEPEQKTLAP